MTQDQKQRALEILNNIPYASISPENREALRLALQPAPPVDVEALAKSFFLTNPDNCLYGNQPEKMNAYNDGVLDFAKHLASTGRLQNTEPPIEGVYLVIQETGCYSDYRARPIFYTTDKARAEEFCSAAKEMAAEFKEKIDAVIAKYEASEDYDKEDRAKQRIMKKFIDPTLSEYELGDVDYTVDFVEALPKPPEQARQR